MKYTKDRTQILRYPSDLSRVWTDIDCPICVRIYSPNVIKTSQNGICWISPARVLFIPVKRALYLFHFCSFRILKLDLLQLQRSSWGWPWTVTKGAFVLFGAQTICVRKFKMQKSTFTSCAKYVTKTFLSENLLTIRYNTFLSEKHDHTLIIVYTKHIKKPSFTWMTNPRAQIESFFVCLCYVSFFVFAVVFFFSRCLWCARISSFSFPLYVLLNIPHYSFSFLLSFSRNIHDLSNDTTIHSNILKRGEWN